MKDTNIISRSFKLHPVKSVIGFSTGIVALIVSANNLYAQHATPIKLNTVECITKDFGTVKFERIAEGTKIGNNCKVIN